MPDMAIKIGRFSTHVMLRPVGRAPETARAFVRHRLLSFGMPAESIDDGCVIASELVTNVVVHVPWAKKFYLSASKDGLTALIAVWDPSIVRPVAVAEPNGESGRGLTIVAALAATWYCEVLPPERGGGKVVAAIL